MRSPATKRQIYRIRQDNPLTTNAFLSAFSEKDPGIDWQVTLEPYKSNRSREQNALMWIWHTAWANEFGHTKEYAHEDFKYRHVLPILLRDDEDGRLNRLYGAAKQDKWMMAALVNILSTTHLSTDQFAEALDEYDRVTAMKGLIFPHPKDRYLEAIGREWSGR